MALSKNVVEEVQATMNGAGGIHHKMDKVLSILTTNGWAQKMTLKPSEILCHPCNRGGAMVSYHDVWSKGQAMLAVGLQVKLLQGSLAMELSKDPAKKKEQVAKNDQLAKESEGHLASVNGQERFLAAC